MTDRALRVIPLGGLGEIGKNMMALEHGDDIIVVDCGVQFPEEDMPGVDLVLPDISYLVERKDKVRAILITHGHEDHTGALPYVLPQLNVPVYAPRLAHGLISVKLREYRLHKSTDLKVAEPNSPVKLGAFEVEFFRVCHSIPDAMGLAIRTPVGVVIHTGDFKIDHTPVDGKTTDLATLARYGSEGVSLLLSDSTYAEVEGYTPSERVVGRSLDRAIGEAPGRVLVASFASLISRIQQVIDAAARHGRNVAFAGRSMQDNVTMAIEMGYIKAPADVIVNVQRALELPRNQAVIMTTGSQGEPTSALVRIANKAHRQIEILPDDTVIISATPIPGNEKVVSRTINNLMRQGARVLYDRVATVHVHGHGSREELKLMLDLTRPKFFVPVHGEYRGLVAHAALARDTGVEASNTFVLEDGDVLEVTGTDAQVVDHVEAGHIYVDGLSTMDIESVVLRDRRLLSRDGIVVIILSFDKATGEPLGEPAVVSSGFVENDEAGELFERVSAAIFDSLNHGRNQPTDWSYINTKVKEIAGDFLYKETGRRPMIVPVTLEV
ncbi:MAG: ribonuclease J [SAR202 cluster bacterium]|nr:ribonuclease J [SAR202 cluster bacterium]